MHNINEKIGIKIKAVRLERKLSREQVARRIGVKQQTVEKYEKGVIAISVIQLTKISNVLNVSIMYFLQPDGDDDSLFKHYLKEKLALPKL